ncbi:hypothetical protein J7L13_03000 [bacterium]|nr:hypothetical protein [bacterium]
MPRLKLIKTEEKEGFKRFYYQLKNQPDKILIKSYYKGHLILRKVYDREALGLTLSKNRKEEEKMAVKFYTPNEFKIKVPKRPSDIKALSPLEVAKHETALVTNFFVILDAPKEWKEGLEFQDLKGAENLISNIKQVKIDELLELKENSIIAYADASFILSDGTTKRGKLVFFDIGHASPVCFNAHLYKLLLSHGYGFLVRPPEPDVVYLKKDNKIAGMIAVTKPSHTVQEIKARLPEEEPKEEPKEEPRKTKSKKKLSKRTLKLFREFLSEEELDKIKKEVEGHGQD